MQNWQAAEQTLLSILRSLSVIYKGAEHHKARSGACCCSRQDAARLVPPSAAARITEWHHWCDEPCGILL